MNLLLNNVRGDIIEANSFYSDPHDAFENFDYVMANPPFNVDEVVVDKVIGDKRFNTYGVPRNKTKGGKKDSDKKETVPNANYLWIATFALGSLLFFNVADYALSIFQGATSPLVLKSRIALLVDNDPEKAMALAAEIVDKFDLDYYYIKAEIMIVTNKADQAGNILLRSKSS